jgi:glycosyltransferase involved in cell wall biosynthesis
MVTNKVSVIVCTKDAEETLESCLESIIDNSPFELIVVDGKSKDQTIAIARKFTKKILSDPGEGLAVARNIGLDNANGDYIFYVGPDNILPNGTIDMCVESLKKTEYIGVAMCVSLFQPKGYFSRCLNFYKQARFFPGEKTVIGTPWFYEGETLRRYRYDPKMKFSDDTDLCTRLHKDGYKVAIIDWQVFEIEQADYLSVKARWGMYGISDSDFFKKYQKDWVFLRKLQSYSHPFHVEIVQVLLSKRILFYNKIYLFPFLVLITYSRYLGWYKNSRINLKIDSSFNNKINQN